MDKIYQKTTEWRMSGSIRARVKYGFDFAFAERNRQATYFSVTHETEELRGGRWREYRGGAGGHKLFPELAALEKWHLFTFETGPLHYAANSLYWWEMGAHGSGWSTPERPGDPHPLDAFKHCCVYGALHTDAAFDPQSPSLKKYEVRTWLDNRLPRLRAVAAADITSAGITIPGNF